MTHPLGGVSFTVLVLYVLGFFSSLTVVALAIGFGMERAFARTKKMFSVPTTHAGA